MNLNGVLVITDLSSLYLVALAIHALRHLHEAKKLNYLMAE